MKEFQKAIKTYLDNRAKQDAQFAENYAKPNKSIVYCCNYIMRQAQKHKGQVVVLSDDEVYGLAVHYYDEDIPAKECRPVRGASASSQPAKAPEPKKAEPKKKKDQERKQAFEAKQLSIW